jgi:succinoglycan biosynthesis protein ExoA
MPNAGDDAPLVSVIMAVRQEGGRHERAIRSVLAQDHPRDRLEIIVVVGASDDDTLAIAHRLAGEDDRIRVIENPDGSTPVSLNLGLAMARGSIVGRVDGHAWVEPDFLSASVEALGRTGVDGVGGIAEHIGHGPVGEAIALAMTSPFGAGNSSFRVGGAEAPADTVVFGMYRAEVFERVGPFDETLRRNQDDEMNHRIRRAGGRLLFAPHIRSSYVVRSRLRDLWRQYHDYGVFRVATLVKHRRPGALRQLAPPALLVVFAGAGLAGVATHRPVGRAAAALYATGLLGGGVLTAKRARRLPLAPIVAAALATMHIAYGVGFWKEVARHVAGRGVTTSAGGS